MEIIKRHVEERLKQHRYNLALWNNGTLTPTEPDPGERAAVKRELNAAINELELLRLVAGPNWGEPMKDPRSVGSEA